MARKRLKHSGQGRDRTVLRIPVPFKTSLVAGGGMKLTAAELAALCLPAVCITEKCDGCGKLLDQTVRHTIGGQPAV